MRPTLSLKVLAVFALVSLCLYPALAYVSIEKLRGILEKGFLEKAKIAVLLLDSSTISIGDLEDVNRQFSSLQKAIWLNPDILRARVSLPVDGALRVYVSSDGAGLDEPASEESVKSFTEGSLVHSIVRREDERVLRVAAPIRIAKKVLGTFDLEYTMESVDQEIMESAELILIAYLGFILVFLVVIYWAVRVIAIGPLKELERVVQGFGGSEPASRLDLRGKDEIGELTARFWKMISDLDVANARLRQAQRLEAMGQLTGGVAHDFNNLLAIIMGNLEMVRESLEGNQELQNHLDSAMRATNRGAELTGRLLSFSREQDLRPVPVDLSDLVEAMADLLRSTLGETVTLTIDVRSEEERFICRIDRTQMENALLNLAINARNAMSDGGALVIRVMSRNLEAAAGKDGSGLDAGSYVAITVTDSGIGMSEEVRARAVEPFFTTRDVGEGSGLGLSMVYGFARQSGGRMTITSALGEGTTIELLLPRLGGEAVVPARDCQLAMPKGDGELVLLVEDEDEVRRVVADALELLNYRVVAAPSASAARIHLSREPRIDVVISDVVLAGDASGPEIVQEVKQRFPGLGVLFMSGYASDPSYRRGIDSSGAELLKKPFEIRTLAHAIRRVLEARA